MRRLALILALLVMTCMTFASSNGGVRHLQPVRVPVILAAYSDVAFKSTDYSDYTASMQKYFADQSFGVQAFV